SSFSSPILPPTPSPPFPYTTLFRSPPDPVSDTLPVKLPTQFRPPFTGTPRQQALPGRTPGVIARFVPVKSSARQGLLARRPGERSEEHTSELQSLAYLVCRLLLETH